ncbi:MAG: signal peptidase II [Desulfomonile tiedjei]|nr:signal peptidase II [Desulfomonile tiedjei]
MAELQVSRINRLTFLGSIACLLLIADQVTKFLVFSRIPLNRAIELIPGVLDLVHARNPGAAFGMMAGSAWEFRSLFFIVVSVVVLVIIALVVAFSKDMDSYLLLAYSLFFGGALGNLVDRVRFGEVIDFIDVHWGDLHWPAFNVADSALSVGAVLFVFHLLLKR